MAEENHDKYIKYSISSGNEKVNFTSCLNEKVQSLKKTGEWFVGITSVKTLNPKP